MTEPLRLPTRRFDRRFVDPGRPLTGRVTAVFAHAASVRTEQPGPLVVLLHPSRDLVPSSIEIPWSAVPLDTGAAVSLAEGILRVGGSIVELRGSGTSLKLTPAPFSASWLATQLRGLDAPERTRAILAAGTQGLAQRREAGGVSEKVIASAGLHLNRLVAHLCSAFASPGDFVELTGRLCGMGPGSTPTGDDVLTGVAAMAHRLARSGQLPSANVEAFLAALKALPRDVTTPVAREMLDFAAAGEFPESLLRLASGLGTEGFDPRELRETMRRLESLGAQSGCDLLAGALGLAYALRTHGGGVA